MLDVVFIFAGLLLFTLLINLARKQRKQTLAGALPCAVEIAASHGWVTPGRLMTHANLTERDANDALVEACRRGLLFQDQDGRYYVKHATLNSGVSNP